MLLFYFHEFCIYIKKTKQKKRLYAFIAAVAFICSKQEYSYSWGYLENDKLGLIEKQRKGKVCAVIRTNNKKVSVIYVQRSRIKM